MKQVVIKIIDTQRNVVVQSIDSALFPFETIENQAAKSSIKLIYEGADDKYQSLMTSSLVFDLLVKDGADGKFYHLFTGSETRYRVDLTDEHNVLLWRGFLLPDQYSEPYKSPTLFVSMTATDGIAALEGKEFSDNTYYTSDNSIISYLCKALEATGLLQDLYFSPAIVAGNGFRWDEIYVNGRLYTEDYEEDEFGIAGTWEKDSVYDVLENIVHDLGCKLFTFNGKWWLIGINQQHKDVISCFRYGYDGVYKGVEQVSLHSERVTFLSDPLISVQSPWKRVEVTASYDADKDVVNEKFYEKDQTVFSNNPYVHWKRVNCAINEVPSEGKWFYEFTYPGQTFPDINPGWPRVIGPAGWKIESDVRGSYIELEKPIWIEKSDSQWEWKKVDFELELVAYTVNGTKEKFDNKEYEDVMRYELLLGNEVLNSNFPNSEKYKDSVLDLRFSQGRNEWQNENSTGVNRVWIESRSSLSGKVKKQHLLIDKSGWLQLRLYPPVLLNNFDPVFNDIGIAKLSIKVSSKNKFISNKIRLIDYSTKKTIGLSHIDNAQDNSKKKFIFKREGVSEQKSWRQSWKRNGVNESLRYGECFARMVHDVQPKPHIKIDGRAVGVHSPLTLFEFHWRENKKFIPTRIELDFSEGKTELTMIENVFEHVAGVY
ncbi:hypothetical protein [Myroides sp. DF42-4-2]|uniref:hypothetical protein n=1 Tax=unclassified Myroides TaxID=2642485 RepID=UPI002577D299|nr:hypothetical protein [Myroides sp. DF42-4-2]MDM1408051.1 hypothetical protein [Myroides sp. DF42-4-2]